MARIRSVHPALHRDKTLAQVSASAERTFVRLWCHLDDEGRAEDDLELLKSDLYPRHHDMGVAAIDADLEELAKLGLVIRYEVAGERYLCCKPAAWAHYQRPQKRQLSQLPPPPEESPTPPNPLRDRSVADTGPASPVVGGEGSSRGSREGEEDARARDTTTPRFEAVLTEARESEAAIPPLATPLAAYRWAVDFVEQTADPPSKSRQVAELLAEYLAHDRDDEPSSTAMRLLVELAKAQPAVNALRLVSTAAQHGPDGDVDWYRGVVRYGNGIARSERKADMRGVRAPPPRAVVSNGGGA